jgi:hypothetical protein
MGFVDEKSPFYEASEDVVELFKKVLDLKSLPFDVKLKFAGNTKQKTFMKVTKIPDQYAWLLDADVLVSINEDFFYKLDEPAQKILIEEEIDKIYVNMDTGKLKMMKPDFVSFSGLIDKYGAEEVMRAKGLETLTNQQKEDSDTELETV